MDEIVEMIREVWEAAVPPHLRSPNWDQRWDELIAYAEELDDG